MARVTKEVSRDRGREAWRLRILGWTQQQIADELGVTQPTICDILKRKEAQLAQEFRDHAEAIKARQAEALWHIYRRAMEEFERSCLDAQKSQVVTGRAKATEFGVIALPDLETTTVEGQAGNPALLAAAMKALSEFRAIWCPDTAKQEVSGPGGGPVAITELVVELKKGDG
jgi:predicted transcriptional regulator